MFICKHRHKCNETIVFQSLIMQNPEQKKQFIETYQKYFPNIFKYCLFRVGSKEDAEDLTEQTFMKTWNYLIEGSEIDNMRAFLFRVAHNHIVDFYAQRKKDQDHRTSLETKDGQTIDIPDAIDIHADAETKELYREAIAELNRLKPEYRDVMLLRYVHDMELTDIAQTLGLSPENVRVRIHRATKKIKEALIE